ncbi:hypothetical protein EDD29_7274 [Actinocorallia herbida]|uniref:Uncharacterized protein n=1 Tax=Actinocorallia herbida TaxID=58109 RepID=A0A3N1D7S7_9ACTN|nr:hypothetical protein [Actinocorallia herbida]ROO89575.1 hypothetical protein EDD29_7274 [Actinocorallia herbida]
MVVSVPAVVLFAVLVWVLWRYAGLTLWRIVLVALFGFLVASTDIAPDITEVLNAVNGYISGIDP